LENAILVGSANFTTGGFHKNHELSILSDNDTFLNKQLVDYFNDLVKEIPKEFLLTFEQIEHEKNQVSSLRIERMDREYSFRKRYGAVLGKHSEKRERIWLKFEGGSKDRLPMSERYCPLVTKELQNGATFYSPWKKPSKVKAGDKIIMVKYCEASSPYVVGRGISAGFSDTNHATDAMIAEHGWMEQYPYYHEFTSFQYIDAPISECIPLNDIIETLESDVYQNTIGKQISKDRVRTWHRQQAQLELTHQAMEYIDALLEEKFLFHGVTELGKPSSDEKRKGRKSTKSTININMIEAAYNVAKEYYLDRCNFQQGRKIVNESSGMNIGSAGNFLVVFRAMMDGNEYHRTLNKEATRYYLENIYNDYGDEQLRIAITACRKHLLYYEEKQSKQPSIGKIVNEFAAKVHM